MNNHTTNSRLLDLPAELRLRVWEFCLLEEDSNILLSIEYYRRKFQCYKDTGIIRTCCQIRVQTLPIFYGRKDLVNAVHSTGCLKFERWMAEMSNYAFTLLRSISFPAWHGLYDENEDCCNELYVQLHGAGTVTLRKKNEKCAVCFAHDGGYTKVAQRAIARMQKVIDGLESRSGRKHLSKTTFQVLWKTVAPST